MFDWIKGKLSKKINIEIDNCIIQNLNFVNMIEEEKFIFNRDIEQNILKKMTEIKKKTERYDQTKKPGNNFSQAETNELMEMNMYCRQVWKNFFKKKALDFDKVFSSNELDKEN